MYTFETFLQDVEESLKNGSSRQRIYKKYGGIMMYIPQKPTDYREKVIEEFNGYNYMELSRKYNLAESSVRRIIREHEDEKKNPTLF